jgi:hypothetical protein
MVRAVHCSSCPSRDFGKFDRDVWVGDAGLDIVSSQADLLRWQSKRRRYRCGRLLLQYHLHASRIFRDSRSDRIMGIWRHQLVVRTPCRIYREYSQIKQFRNPTDTTASLADRYVWSSELIVVDFPLDGYFPLCGE